MGCDIHSFAEVHKQGHWVKVGDVFTDCFDGKKTEHPFDWRSYGMYGFLADVRNYSHCTPLSQPKGIPPDVSDEVSEEVEKWESDAHSHSYFTLAELLEFDYDKTFWDRRIERSEIMPNGGTFTDGAALAEEGEGQTITYREHLGTHFFVNLDELKALGEPDDVRIVFFFDN